MESTPMNVRNLERLNEKKFKTYDEAQIQRAAILGGKPAPDKVKIFARNNGTFDVVTYKKIGVVVKEQVVEKAAVPEKVEKVHGLKSKERKKPFVPKKFA
jgi:hypothetical protein